MGVWRFGGLGVWRFGGLERNREPTLLFGNLEIYINHEYSLRPLFLPPGVCHSGGICPLYEYIRCFSLIEWVAFIK